MDTRYYHVTDGEWDNDDLLCWNIREEYGLAGEWKWEEAEPGYDGDIVCLFESLEEAEIFKSDFLSDAAEILAIDLPEDIKTITNGEGFRAVFSRIPSEYIRRL